MENFLQNFSVCEALNCQVRTDVSASVRKILGGSLYKVVNMGLLGLASQVTPLEKQFWKLNRQGRKHTSTGALAGSQLQLEIETLCVLQEAFGILMERVQDQLFQR